MMVAEIEIYFVLGALKSLPPGAIFNSQIRSKAAVSYLILRQVRRSILGLNA